ncbi:putative multiple epidermal growth factor-like domains protein 6-like [Apostichopus japonicus]|uniref:Putative multiple epidermal growth factor-like domains protein 6-like n=1 Tax=Stichopus japonicus TaxID=307972 RepID=A0A2G8LGC1_STIJA|nr:putative multiple epidermal growth factor-like domains protein 6-like [Apostichopus japonicus]
MGKTAVSLALAREEQDVTMSTVRVTVQWGHTVGTVPCHAQKDSTEKIADTPASVRTMADVMPKQVPAVVQEDGKVLIVKNCAAMAHMALTALRTVSAKTMQHATQSTVSTAQIIDRDCSTWSQLSCYSVLHDHLIVFTLGELLHCDCTCSPGWQGKVCNRPCPEGRYGQDCRDVCDCVNGICLNVDGTCQCEFGYHGDSCNMSCPQGLYGPGCAYGCNCQNGGECDRVTGGCVCSRGYTGANCTVLCGDNFFGQNCSESCNCQNGASCDRIDGSCTCSDGWSGTHCDLECKRGFYGRNCSRHCQCENQGLCHHIHGTCTCKPGWQGPSCAVSCVNGTYGQNCARDCACSNGGICHPVTGVCDCPPGFHGDSCEDVCSGELTWKSE